MKYCVDCKHYVRKNRLEGPCWEAGVGHEPKETE